MPIIIPKDLPAYDVLQDERVFVMEETRAVSQDIRPIEVAIVNLMPTKIQTETQIMRVLANSPLQINVTLIKMSSYESKNTSKAHLEKFYKTFDEIKGRKFDAMIVTGAPVETMEFSEVAYWSELKDILDYAKEKVTSTVFICWGAQAGLNYYYGIEKVMLPEKMFGIYANRATEPTELLLKGLDDVFYIPMSRHTTMNEQQIKNHPELEILATTKEGSSIIKSRDNKNFFFFGHSEYDRDTLKTEYLRDVQAGLEIKKPINYFEGDDLDRINVTWRSTATIMFVNWLNYYVYQITPYDL